MSKQILMNDHIPEESKKESNIDEYVSLKQSKFSKAREGYPENPSPI